MSTEYDGSTTLTRILRERGPDRRRRSLHALWRGNFAQRRRGPRRADDNPLTAHDWHHPQWLAVSVGILLLCCADALFTLHLIQHGASEINPIMRPLVAGSTKSFVLWKFGLTASGVLVLVQTARTRAFGRWRVGPLLYLLLLAYVALIGYEYWLLQSLDIDLLPLNAS